MPLQVHDRSPRHELQKEHHGNDDQNEPLPKPSVGGREFSPLGQCFGRVRHKPAPACFAAGYPRLRARESRPRGLGALWQALTQAEADFTEAQEALAAVPIAGMGDLKTMIVSAELYDGIELCRINRSPISRAVVAAIAATARGGS
jgi:hypothetical protein